MFWISISLMAYGPLYIMAQGCNSAFSVIDVKTKCHIYTLRSVTMSGHVKYRRNSLACKMHVTLGTQHFGKRCPFVRGHYFVLVPKAPFSKTLPQGHCFSTLFSLSEVQNEDQHHSDKEEMQLTNIIVTSTPCIPPVSIEICSVTWRWIRHHLIVWIISDWASILPPHPELKQRLD